MLVTNATDHVLLDFISACYSSKYDHDSCINAFGGLTSECLLILNKIGSFLETLCLISVE